MQSYLATILAMHKHAIAIKTAIVFAVLTIGFFVTREVLFVIEGQKIYRNPELGFAFAYPASWGEVLFEKVSCGPPQKKGEPFGDTFLGKFTNNTRCIFSGSTPSSWRCEPDVFHRESSHWGNSYFSALDFSGWRKGLRYNGKYLLSSNLDPAIGTFLYGEKYSGGSIGHEDDISLNAHGMEMLIQYSKPSGFSDFVGIPGGMKHPGLFTGGINLPHSRFPGIQIQCSGDPRSEKNVAWKEKKGFYRMMNSFHLEAAQ
jgi:hypothetical protein